jgi:hypothetical protein
MARRHMPVIVILVLISAVLTTPVAAQPVERCFPETGYCVGGAILQYWESHGGLRQFGYPISPVIPNETVEDTWVGPTQWFERARLEDHGASGVLGGRLGAKLLELQGRSWWEFPRPAIDPKCWYANETAFQICEPFLSYWRAHGGLARFGLPLSQPVEEQTSEWRGVVQYFERVRMEWHPELRGTGYEALLGRIGAEVKQAAPPVLCTGRIASTLQPGAAATPFREWLGCPLAISENRPAAVQRMQHGVFLWLDVGNGDKQIYYAYAVPEPGSPLIYGRAADTWQEGVDPVDYGIRAPAGLYPPLRGFGKVWWMAFRRGPNFIGFGLEPERSERATIQRFSSGAVLVRLAGSGEFFGFGRTARDLSLQ